MNWEGKGTDAYTYHTIACLPINFRADKNVQNTPPIIETEVLDHPLYSFLIPITNYVAQEKLTERIRECKNEWEMKWRRRKKNKTAKNGKRKLNYVVVYNESNSRTHKQFYLDVLA